MNKKTIEDIQVKGQRVLCRVDFNVPVMNGQIQDETRIREAIPTIQYLVQQGAKLILVTHLGRPKGEVNPDYRLDFVAHRLAELLGQEVFKLDQVIGPEVAEHIADMQEGDIVLLENVRFHPGEEKNDPQFIKELARLADFYVNDAFGVSHRAHASIAGVAQHLPAVAGFLLQKELDILGQALKQPERPFTAIIGGAKVKDKIGVIDQLMNKVDYLLIGGGLSFTFIKAQGYSVGNSLLEEDKVELAQEYIARAKQNGVQLVLPIDCVVADAFSKEANTQVVNISDIPDNWLALDCGPKTSEKYSAIIRDSKLVLWNGPMGVFELEPFAGGTNAVARAVADCPGTTIIGGGDSAAAVQMAGLSDQITHISTGGGASLEFMEGKELPGVQALNDKKA